MHTQVDSSLSFREAYLREGPSHASIISKANHLQILLTPIYTGEPFLPLFELASFLRESDEECNEFTQCYKEMGLVSRKEEETRQIFQDGHCLEPTFYCLYWLFFAWGASRTFTSFPVQGNKRLHNKTFHTAHV